MILVQLFYLVRVYPLFWCLVLIGAMRARAAMQEQDTRSLRNGLGIVLQAAQNLITVSE